MPVSNIENRSDGAWERPQNAAKGVTHSVTATLTCQLKSATCRKPYKSCKGTE
ncbi:hypothetical protein BDN67DRAFT_972804 [Paxillus ammoniavirescens]|nr:hypothetical protein BDN67DRAFT_972804 [Paxillus ammoniavirescens]